MLRQSLIEEGAVVSALEEGCQTLLVHQASLFEGPQGASPVEFFLVPFLNREQGDNLVPTAGIFVHRAQSARNAQGQADVHAYAVVQARFHIPAVTALARMEGLHIWRPDYLEREFRRGPSGLLVSAVRVYVLAEHLWIDPPSEPPAYPAWHELAEPVSTQDAQPVLPDDKFGRQLSAMRAVLKHEIPIAEGGGS